MKETVSELKKIANEMILKFNGKPCKNGCNCLELAEQQNVGQGVKEYPCLGGADIGLDKKESWDI